MNKKLIGIASGCLLILIICIISISSCSKKNKEQSKETTTKATINTTTKETKTEAKTEAQTEKVTEKQTEPQTEPVTEAPTEPQTEPVTQAPTVAPTEAPTQAPTQAPTEAPTEAPTQAKKGWGGTIYEELVGYGLSGATRVFPKTDSELGDRIVCLTLKNVETYVFHNEVAMGISKPEDIVAIYGEPRLVYVSEIHASEGYTWLCYRYR